MINLFDIIDRATYQTAVDKGYIKVQTHPSEPYLIHNYTDACTWDQAWDEATLNCRGMITDIDYNIIARGMKKFFNHDQEQAPQVALDDEVLVFDKADGSLGILYRLQNLDYAIATRGSFASEQAIWATQYWIEHFDHIQLSDDYTHLFEIIYPDNRIVVDYDGLETLRYLGSVNKKHGNFIPPANASKSFDAVEFFGTMTWGEVLSSPDRSNAEGYVLYHIKTGQLLKLKFEEYKRLHKYMTRVTERHVWECLVEDRSLKDEFAGAPDEFHQWVWQVATRLTEEFDRRHIQLILNYRKLRFGPNEALFEVDDPREAKKNWAMAIKDEPDKALYFAMFDDKTVIPALWKEFKPAATTFKTVSSDAD